MQRPPVVVTRPRHEALQWVERLRDAGLNALALPLIEIGPAPEPDALRRAWAELPRHAAVMFVSANAVRAFFDARPAGSAFGARAWAPGPGTREALLAAGVDPSAIDSPADDAPQFDSENLWARVSGSVAAGQRILIVRGGGDAGSGRDWLARQLQARNVAIDTVTAYVRAAPVWSPRQREDASRLLDDDGATWIFSSSEAIANLAALLPGRAFSGASALVTHPRIGEAAKRAGFGRVRATAARLRDVVAALESS
ncbi:uroporphyrinogen-III synthase [Ramlibacter sp.]|uniref:uroporphyrinogen-III synthase n=1 Tax=Ramlibacter sp. TaxID=1917967 RepID=UPI003D0C350C